MTTRRAASLAEIETLQVVLSEALPKACEADLTARAIESARAIRAAFDELYGVVTPGRQH